MSAKKEAPVMTLGRLEIPGDVRALLACAAVEKSRYAMIALAVDRRGGFARAVATNGKMLAVRSWPDPGPDGGLRLLPLPALREAWEGSRAPLLLEGHELIRQGRKRKAVLFEDVEGYFPPWKEVLPSAPPSAVVILDISTLAFLADAWRAMPDEVAKITLLENKGGCSIAGQAVGRNVVADARLTVEFSCSTSAPVPLIGFNPAFLLAAAKAVTINPNEPRVTLFLRGPENGATLCSGEREAPDERTFAVVMPVALV